MNIIEITDYPEPCVAIEVRTSEAAEIAAFCEVPELTVGDDGQLWIDFTWMPPFPIKDGLWIVRVDSTASGVRNSAGGPYICTVTDIPAPDGGAMPLDIAIEALGVDMSNPPPWALDAA